MASVFGEPAAGASEAGVVAVSLPSGVLGRCGSDDVVEAAEGAAAVDRVAEALGEATISEGRDEVPHVLVWLV